MQGAERVDVQASGGSYPVFVGSGLLQRLPALTAPHTPSGRVALISDDRVGPLHGEAAAQSCRDAGLDVTYLSFPAGEASKTRKSWSILTDQMLDEGLGRDSLVIGFGGGVTTDLAGFVAATYLRGVPIVQVPTSYLAMIDASVGGKTGVDVRAGKNLVGAFHPPVAVLADVDLLETLPDSERREGLVEAVKHGAVADAGYFEALVRELSQLVGATAASATSAVLRSVEIKAEVVGQDEFEGGYRKVLNFGHTLGHAIEAAARYEVGHGTAVALGMIGEAAIGEELGVTANGVTERLESALRTLLPKLGAPVEVAEAMTFLGADKKARGGRTRYVLLEEIGRAGRGEDWSYDVPVELARTVLTRVLGQA